MRNLKKFLALVLAMVMAFSLMVTANAANPKTDYPDFDEVTPEFQEAVDVLSGMGVFRGNNGDFKPDQYIYRAEVAAIIYRLTTHDVTDSQVELYAPLAAHFSDVDVNAWYAGYVGYCVDAGYIKGYNGEFKPMGYVTGYETLAMILRAVGYGKNGEFNGSTWRVQVGSLAESLGILNTLKSTHYANTLSQYSRRDVVADLLFEASLIPTVTWTPAGGYNKYVGVPSAQNPGANTTNPYLAYREFGLVWDRAVILGNQGTGENVTHLGESLGTYRDYVDDTGKPQRINWGYYYPGSVVVLGSKTTVNGTAGTDVTDDIIAPEGLRLNYKTGLDQFAHQVKVWIDGRTTGYSNGATTYAVLDEVLTVKVNDETIVLDQNEFVGTKTGTTTVGDVTGADSGTEWWSDRYCQIAPLAFDATTNTSPISTYRVVQNPTGTVYVALSSEVAQITQKNSTVKKPYIILGSDAANASTYGNGTAGTVLISNLTDTKEELYKQPGETLIVNEIVGTSFTLASAAAVTATTAKADGQPGAGAIMYQLVEPEKKTITVNSLLVSSDNLKIDAPDGANAFAVVKVFPTEGNALELSGITYGTGAKSGETTGTSEIISAILPIVVKEVATTETKNVIALKAGVSYTAWLDQGGRFISIVPDSGYKFIYGTYADYDIANGGAGTIDYNLVGVDEAGKEQFKNPLKSVTLNIDTTVANANTVITTLDDLEGKITSLTGFEGGAAYGKITTTKKDQGQVAGWGNQIQPGYDTGYWYNASTGDLAAVDASMKMTDQLTGGGETVWTITAQDAVNGFVKVTNGIANDGTAADAEYLLTKNTKFHVVSGTGTATLKVDNFTGLADFLDGATSAQITYDAWDDTILSNNDGNEDEVVFFTYATKYGSVNTGDNYEITDVFLSDGNLVRWNAQTLYFNYASGSQNNPTGLMLTGTPDGSDVEQYDLWQGKDKVSVFVDKAASIGGLDLSTAGNKNMFIVLSEVYKVGTTPVYKATLAPANGTVAVTDAGVGNLFGAGFASKDGVGGSKVIYDYVAVSNLKTGLFKDTAERVLSMDNATVVDVQWLTTSSLANTRNEIKTVEELNNAVSVGKLNGDLTYGIDVAVVYDNSNSSAVTVYVLDVAAT